MPDWPFPDDSSIERARRVAVAYRTALQIADPGTCAQLDERMRYFNQGWVLGQLSTRDDNDLVSGREAAELLSVTPGAIRVYRSRGQLFGHRTASGWMYRVGDLRNFRPTPPGRPKAAVA